MGIALKDLIKPLVPYRVRVIIRSLLERKGPSQWDVERVKTITVDQWRSLGTRTPKYLQGYWDNADDDSKDTRGKRRSAWLADLPEFHQIGSALELGSGAGRNLYMLQQRHPELKLYGVDINPEGIEHTRVAHTHRSAAPREIQSGLASADYFLQD